MSLKHTNFVNNTKKREEYRPKMQSCPKKSHQPSIVILALLLCLIHRSEANCVFSHHFGSGDDLDTDGVEGGFHVAADVTTHCKVTCDSGGRTSLFLRYGGAAGVLFHDASDFSLRSCDIDIQLESDHDEDELGWALSVSAPYSNLQLSCTCSQPGPGTGNPDESWGCFSGDSIVETLGKGRIPMAELKVGDQVLTDPNQYQTVYSFGHYHEAQKQEFLQVYTPSNSQTPLEVTKDHLIFVPNNGREEVIRADALQVGDRLIASNQQQPNATIITQISTIRKKGVYMPLTQDGTIVVNGLKASTYISLLDHAPQIDSMRGYFGIDSEQTLLHWWLSPYRMLCVGVSAKFCGDQNHNNLNEEGILDWLALGNDLMQFAEHQNAFVQVLVFGPPLFVVFALLNLVESLMGPALAPVALLLMSVVFWRLRRRRNAVAGDLVKSRRKTVRFESRGD